MNENDKDIVEKDNVTEVIDNDVEEEVEDTSNEDSEEFSDNEEDDNEENSKDKKAKDKDSDLEDKKKQSKKENSKYAQLRREQEAKEKEDKDVEKIRQEAYEQALVDSVDGINPYTKKEIKTPKDRQVFMKMRELEKEGLDPISDYYQYDDLIASKKEQAKKFDFNADGQAFIKKYPNVDMNELINDEAFSDYATPFLEKVSLIDIYESYNKMKAKFESEADKKARKLVAKAKSSPGAVSSNSNNEPSYLTMDQIKKMSQKEVDEKFDLVEKSMAYHMKNKK